MKGPRHTIAPQLAKRLLFWFLRRDLAEEVEGDLEENFIHQLNTRSPVIARLNYWYQVLNYLRPFALRRSTSVKPFPMFRHNLIISFRSFNRNRSTFIINLIGLSTGIACALLIYLWVDSEIKMDKFHEKSDRLMQVMQRSEFEGGISVYQSTPWLLAETLEKEIPEIEQACVATPTDWFGDLTLSIGENAVRVQGIYASKNYFSMFTYPFIHGDPARSLVDKNSIVITRELAVRLFNSADEALGKVVEFQHEAEYTISGVVEGIPDNSSVRFDFVLPINLLIDLHPQVTAWKNSGPGTYALLRQSVKPDDVNPKIKDMIRQHSDDKHREIFLTRYADTYLFNHYENGILNGGRIDYVILFSIIAVFILSIACINFMNLATAQAARRIKEVGVKKSVGAARSSLVAQYLSESVLVSCFALLVALVASYLVLPQFNLITGKHLTLSLSVSAMAVLFIITLLTGVLAGSYPALYLSRFKPSQILKGKLFSGVGEAWTRKGLVVFQFALTILFITSVIIIYKQLNFIQNRNLGYDKDNLIHFKIEGEIKNHTETFLNELASIPGVVKTSTIAQSMVGGGNTTEIGWEGKDPDVKIHFAYRPVNFETLDMLGLQLLEGRFFSRQVNDSVKVVFNEAGIKAMGLQDPIGKKIQFGPFQSEIIGIVKDFHFESMHSAVEPLFFVLAPQYTERIIVKIEKGKEKETLSRIQDFYSSFNPGFAFSFRFVDQDYQELYLAEQRVATLSRYFAALAILISCLGLFGLASYTTERRRKEIGIRKVMGSNNWGIIYLLSKDFVSIIVVAAFVAVPVSYFIASNWLDNFAYHIPLQAIYFLGATALVLLIALATVSTQALKASRVNPAQCLKEE